MMKVIVEPDDAAAWIGLIGVVVGALITGGIELLRHQAVGSTERRKELQRANDDLIGAANALVTLRGALASPRAEQEPLIEWLQALMAKAEQVRRASETVIRLGSDDIGRAAERVAATALQ
jgi:hypothetical protein